VDTTEHATSGFRCRSILVGTDGSPEAALAVDWAAGLAHALDATVTVVHALALMDHLPGQPETISVDIRDSLLTLLETEWTSRLRELGVAHECVMEDGPPLLAIPRVAARVGADLIVVASHGRGRSTALLMGSTSHGLAQTSSLPLVILPVRGDNPIQPGPR